MNFNTLDFALVLLPITLVLFYLAPRRLRIPVLLCSSWIFYGVSGRIPLAFMGLSIVWGFLAALLQAKARNVITLVLAISFPFLVLWAFKYLGFTLDTLGAGAAWRHLCEPVLLITLPAGISFYTLQMVSYNIDVHHEAVCEERRPLLFATYISFFAQLIAGPIVRFAQMKSQLERVAMERILSPDLRSGVKYLSVGLFAKIFFSDCLLDFHGRYDFHTDVFADRALFAVLSYSMIIYYDFWSYSLMAIGIGKLFSLDLPKNFREPYLSLSPADFWARWHVTLSFWVRDYLFLPLSLSLRRSGASEGGNALAYGFALVVSFLAVGLWHGAGGNFVTWGAYHAALVIGYHVVQSRWDRLPSGVQITLTFLLVSIGWPLFYLDLGDYATFLRVIPELQLTGDRSHLRELGLMHWGWLSAIMIWTFFFRESRWLWSRSKYNPLDNPLVLAAMAFLAMAFLRYRATFIYFRF